MPGRSGRGSTRIIPSRIILGVRGDPIGVVGVDDQGVEVVNGDVGKGGVVDCSSLGREKRIEGGHTGLLLRCARKRER